MEVCKVTSRYCIIKWTCDLVSGSLSTHVTARLSLMLVDVEEVEGLLSFVT